MIIIIYRTLSCRDVDTDVLSVHPTSSGNFGRGDAFRILQVKTLDTIYQAIKSVWANFLELSSGFRKDTI